MNHTILIADIGGTNARFAVASANEPYFTHPRTFQCSEFETPEKAVQAYLEQEDIGQISGMFFAVAGAVVNETIRFTNNHWFLDMKALAKCYSVSSAKLLNDFEAIAYSLPHLNQEQVESVGGRWSVPTGNSLNLAVVGPGSGLGVGGLVKHGENLILPLVTEGGHSGFSPENPEQLELLRVLFEMYPRVSNERLLSGPGLENLYKAVCILEGFTPVPLSAKEIGETGAKGENGLCERALAWFFEILGQVAGDVVLNQAAYNGLYVGGGICQRYPEAFARSSFRKAFESKGRHSHLLEKTPTFLIKEKNPGLIGASSFATHLLT